MSTIMTPLHEQLRAAREAHGYTQEKLAGLTGLYRTDIQRIERGENVTIRKIEAYISGLPHLESLQFGGVEIRGKITVDVDSVRQMVLDMVTTGANVLQVLGQTEEKQGEETPREETPAPQPRPPLEGPVGATRYRRKRVVSEELKEHLRRIDPTYKRSSAAREAAARGASMAPATPADDVPPSTDFLIIEDPRPVDEATKARLRRVDPTGPYGKSGAHDDET